jgi:hypothetical protein
MIARSDLPLGSDISHGGQPGDQFMIREELANKNREITNEHNVATKIGKQPKLGMWNKPIETGHFIKFIFVCKANNVEFANDNTECTNRTGHIVSPFVG